MWKQIENLELKTLTAKWSLTDDAFVKIKKDLTLPSIDLFASRSNKKCIRFYSWKRDTEAIAVDAFTQDWSTEPCFYACPPFALILRTLRG